MLQNCTVLIFGNTISVTSIHVSTEYIILQLEMFNYKNNCLAIYLSIIISPPLWRNEI